jgi:hypothetical protein
VSLGNHSAVQLFDGDALRSKVTPLIVGTEWPHRGPFAVQGDAHPSRERILGLTLDGPQLTSGDDGRLCSAEPPPVVEPAVREQNFVE